MGRLAVLVVAWMGLVAPALAGTVYRCVGPDGITNYSSKRVAKADCKVVSTGASQARLSSFSPGKATPVVPAPPPATVAATGATSATGTATTSPSPAATVAPGQQVVFNTSPTGTPAAPPKKGGDTRVLRGAVYRFERDGVTHYTNVKPRGAAQSKLLFSYVETCYACGLLPGVNFGTVRLNTSAYASEIRAAALQFGVEEAIVRAVIHAESAYRANAVSHAGAQGLMQLIPATASRFGVSDPFDPAQNIRGGVRYLAWLMKRYSSNLTLVAAAYNAGEGAVDRNGGVPPYSETQRYVLRVGQLADRYRTALAGP